MDWKSYFTPHAEVGQETGFGPVVVTVVFLHLLSFLLHMLLLGRCFYSIMGFLSSLAFLLGTGVQLFLKNAT